MKTSTLLHLRIPFSFFLLPVFLLGAAAAPRIDWLNFVFSFVCLHLLLYPAANAFNSFYDRDEGSIGCLEKPPPVEPALLRVSLALDAAALLLGLLVSWQFSLALLLYGICSKLYSHSATRLKRRPVASAVGVALVQGGFCLLASFYAVQKGGSVSQAPPFEAVSYAAIASLALLGAYPLTQVYQIAEDLRRGDRSLSALLGTRGSFVFSGATLSVAGTAFLLCVLVFHGAAPAALAALLCAPAAASFLLWARACRRDPSEASYKPAMRVLLLGSAGANAIALGLLVLARLQACA